MVLMMKRCEIKENIREIKKMETEYKKMKTRT